LNNNIFENEKIKDLDFTDIYNLVEPIKKLGKEVWLPDLYFIEGSLKKYAGMNEDYKIKAFIEHAAQLTPYIDGGFQISPNLPSIVSSPFRKFIIEKVPNNNGAYAVGPYISYSKSALSSEKTKHEKERLNRNLLVFPSHSIRGVKSSYDLEIFCNEIKKVGKEFDSIRVCLFWKDVVLGTGENYKKHGFEVVTAGHYYDPMFMPRLKSIIETSSMTMSNEIGTHLGYCIYLKKPHYLFKSEILREKLLNDGHEMAEINFLACKTLKSFSDYYESIEKLFQSKEETITKEQYSIIDYYWGLNQIKSPKKLKEIILLLEGRYSLENNLESSLKNMESKEQLLNKTISDQNKLIQYYSNSLSWKITKHLRWARRLVRKIK
jgi:hypothetical protein